MVITWKSDQLYQPVRTREVTVDYPVEDWAAMGKKTRRQLHATPVISTLG